MATTDHIKFGDGLVVTDEGSGVIRVDGVGGPTGPTGPTGPGVAAGGSTGQVLTKTSGTDYDTGWKTLELGFALITANVAVTPTTTGSAVILLTANVTCDGSLIVFEFSSPHVAHNTAGGYTFFSLWDGSTNSGILASIQAAAAGAGAPVRGTYRGIPSAGAHTFTIRAHVSVGQGTVFAGAGGDGGYLPAFLRITRG